MRLSRSIKARPSLVICKSLGAFAVQVHRVLQRAFVKNGYIAFQVYIYSRTVTSTTQSSIDDLARELTPCSNPRTIEDKDPRHHRKQCTDASEQAACRAETEVVVHLRCDEGKNTTWGDLSAIA